MRWFDWIRPSECEIAGCLEPAARSAYILASARAWMCTAHAAALDVGPPLKTKSRTRMTVTQPASVFAESRVEPVGDDSAVEGWLAEGGRDVQPERERRSPEPTRLAGRTPAKDDRQHEQ